MESSVVLHVGKSERGVKTAGGYLTCSAVNEIVELRRSGWTRAMIADAMDCHVSTVGNWLKRRGLVCLRKWGPAQDKAFLELQPLGLSACEIAREIGFSAGAVRHHGIRLGHPVRRKRIPDSRRLETERLRAAGLTYREIASRQAVSRGAVAGLVRQIKKRKAARC
jgi:DNA-directed RNA polymerase specialized sigma24 family protein